MLLRKARGRSEEEVAEVLARLIDGAAEQAEHAAARCLVAFLVSVEHEELAEMFEVVWKAARERLEQENVTRELPPGVVDLAKARERRRR